MPELSSYLVIGAVAAGVTFVMTPIVGWLARRRGWVYLPNDRTVHQTPLPDVGGLAMFVGFVAALFTAWLLGAFDVVFDNNSEPLGVLIAAAAIFTVGFIDDIKEISAPAKVIGTVVAGVALVWFGVVMFSFRVAVLRRPDHPVRRPQAADHGAVAARDQPGDQPHRRARRARRGHRRDRRVRRSSSTARSSPTSDCSTRGTSARCWR